jgi:surface protein
MESMFKNCESLTLLNISNFQTSKVKNMQYMFDSCVKLAEIDINPKLFDNNALKPEIRKKAEEVVNEFLKILAEDEVKLKVRDVILTGSNASYNYTANSDVDLHILADTAQFDDPEQLHKKLYNCYRRLFESKFDITFYGIPVEIYVETEDNPVVSNGIYSVMYDKWVKEPTRDYVKEVDQKEIAEFAKP